MLIRTSSFFLTVNVLAFAVAISLLNVLFASNAETVNVSTAARPE